VNTSDETPPSAQSARSGLRDRMGRLFAIQITVISLATLIGIYLTQLVV
jgi:hypothetical protein